MFWNVIRRSKDPEILPLGYCEELNDPNKLNKIFESSDVTKVLTTCVLDSCEYSSCMISNHYVPEYTYGK